MEPAALAPVLVVSVLGAVTDAPLLGAGAVTEAPLLGAGAVTDAPASGVVGALGAAALGDAALGDAALGDVVLGEMALGDASLGAAALGAAVLGAAVLGEAVLGDVVLGFAVVAAVSPTAPLDVFTVAPPVLFLVVSVCVVLGCPAPAWLPVLCAAAGTANAVIITAAASA